MSRSIIKASRNLFVCRLRIFCCSALTTRKMSSNVCNDSLTPMDKLNKNPYYEKYQEKLKQLQQSNSQEFSERLEALEETKKNAARVPENIQASSGIRPGSINKSLAGKSVKSLDDVIKVDMLKDLPPTEISNIWKSHFVKKEAVCATLPHDGYEKMKSLASKYPLFLYAVPRDAGYEFVVGEFQDNAVHFTTLLLYQSHGENAPVCASLRHYTELAATKGIILMAGQYDSNVLNSVECQCLANQVQMYYCNQKPQHKELLHTFNLHPDKFNHNDVIKQLTSLGLGDLGDRTDAKSHGFS